MEAFLEAIPWPFAKEIRMKKIENLKKPWKRLGLGGPSRQEKKEEGSQSMQL